MFNFLRRYAGRFSRDMGIDLGTANTLVHVQGRGILLREPSVIAIDRNTNDAKAFGEEAKRMLGRTPGHIVAIRPLKDGVIADFDQTERMMRYFIEKVHRRKGFVHPMVVVGVPSGITEVEKMAVIEAAKKAGAHDADTIEEPFAAAIGAGHARRGTRRLHDRGHRRRHVRGRRHLPRRHRRRPLHPRRRGRD